MLGQSLKKRKKKKCARVFCLCVCGVIGRADERPTREMKSPWSQSGRHAVEIHRVSKLARRIRVFATPSFILGRSDMSHKYDER